MLKSTIDKSKWNAPKIQETYKNTGKRKQKYEKSREKNEEIKQQT